MRFRIYARRRNAQPGENVYWTSSGDPFGDSASLEFDTLGGLKEAADAALDSGELNYLRPGDVFAVLNIEGGEAQAGKHGLALFTVERLPGILVARRGIQSEDVAGQDAMKASDPAPPECSRRDGSCRCGD